MSWLAMEVYSKGLIKLEPRSAPILKKGASRPGIPAKKKKKKSPVLRSIQEQIILSFHFVQNQRCDAGWMLYIHHRLSFLPLNRHRARKRCRKWRLTAVFCAGCSKTSRIQPGPELKFSRKGFAAAGHLWTLHPTFARKRKGADKHSG